MKKLPQKIVINDVTYTFKEEYTNEEPFSDGIYFTGYWPPEDYEEPGPPQIRSGKYMLYLIGCGLGPTNVDKLKEEAYEDIFKRLEDAREFYPGIDEAMKKLEE